MNDCKELIIIKILSELQEKYDINNLDVKNILEKHLGDYTMLSNETALMASDIEEKMYFYICLKRLEGLSEKSLENYVCEIRMFSNYVRKPVRQITTNDIRGYLSTIKQERHYENVTINNKISYLRGFFETLLIEEIITKNPMLKIKKLKFNAKEARDPLTAEELEIVRNSCNNIREKAMVEFLVSTGVRVTEAVDTRLSDINWNDCSLSVIGKGDKTRTVFFSIKCKLYLQEYIKTRGCESDGLFLAERSPHAPLAKSGIEKAIKKIAKRTNIIKKISPHVFRHTYASLALQKGMDIVTISQLLGHESVTTTQIYAKTNTKMLQIAYEKFIAA